VVRTSHSGSRSTTHESRAGVADVQFVDSDDDDDDVNIDDDDDDDDDEDGIMPAKKSRAVAGTSRAKAPAKAAARAPAKKAAPAARGKAGAKEPKQSQLS
jgi:hypothetical protein